MNDQQIFELGDFALHGGLTLKDARIAYQNYGSLAEDRSNVILYPTSYGAQHTDLEWLIGAGKILDPTKHFIIIPNMFWKQQVYIHKSKTTTGICRT